MADDSNRIGSSRSTAGMELLRQISGVGGPSSAGATPAVEDAGTSINVTVERGAGTPAGAFGPRGNRVLPADMPVEQLDRRAARGTYLDILV